MVKVIKIIGVCVISILSVLGCQKQHEEQQTRMIHQELSTKENYLLALTDNNVAMYEIYDLPTDMSTEIELTYEVYKKGEKVTEDILTTLINDHNGIKSELRTIGLNIQDDKIKYIIGEDGGYVTGQYILEETVEQYTREWLSNQINLELGDEVYIFYAQSGSSVRVNMLGEPISTEKLNKVLEENDTNIFIKISYKAF